MKQIILAILAAAFIGAVLLKPVAADRRAERAEEDMAAFKEDVRRMINEMDNAGDLPKYMENGRFQHVYNYTHNLEDDYGKE